LKKTVIILVTLGGLMLTMFIVARLTHVIDVWSITSESNEPTLRYGNIVFASRFIKPDHGKFVCYRPPGKKGSWIHRCIGVAGDIVEIKNGEVYVNGQALTEPYTWNEYYIDPQQKKAIAGYIEKFNYPLNPFADSTEVITFSEADRKNYHLKLDRVITGKGAVDSTLFKDFARQGFNIDNFGPVKVPPNSYFLLGDNRHNAMDSRFLGFIKEADIVSTVASAE